MAELERSTFAWSRRDVVGGAAALFATPAAAAGHPEGHSVGSGLSPSAALQRLMAGNARYASARSAHPDVGQGRRSSLIGGQHPFATILGCADSRVAPEVVFDQGLGDLFVVRDAGNVTDDVVLASIEYSVIHLGTPLVMVLGHERCGAVTAAVEALAGKSNEADRGAKIGVLAGLIAPAVRAVPANDPNKVDAAVLLNARRVADQILATSAPIREHVRSGRLSIVSARYRLESGRVSDLLAARGS